MRISANQNYYPFLPFSCWICFRSDEQTFRDCINLTGIRFEGDVQSMRFLGPGLFVGGPGQVLADVSELEGKTIMEVKGFHKGSGLLTFLCSDGSMYQMYNVPRLCDGIPLTAFVEVMEDYHGEMESLLGSEILKVTETVARRGAPEALSDPWLRRSMMRKTSPRVFYKITTRRGRFRMLWHSAWDFFKLREAPYFMRILAESGRE